MIARRSIPKPEPTPEALFRRAIDKSLRAMKAWETASAACQGDMGRQIKAGMLYTMIGKYLAQMLADQEAAKIERERPAGASAAAYLPEGGRA